MARYLNITSQALDKSGNTINRAQLHFFEAGPTNTRLDTFQDEDLTIANTNPVISDNSGRFPDIWLQGEKYYIELRDGDGVLLDSADNVTGQVTSGASTLLNIAALTAIEKSTLLNGTVFEVDGYTTRGDGGGGRFYWNSASTDIPNSGTIFQSDEGGAGRWIRIFSGPVNLLWFGAVGDGSTDDTAAINATKAFAGSNLFLGAPGRTFRYTSQIIWDGQNFDGLGCIFEKDFAGAGFLFQSGRTTLSNMQNNAATGQRPTDYDGNSTEHGMNVNTAIDLNNVRIRYHKGDGCYINNDTGSNLNEMTWIKVTSRDNGRDNIRIDGDGTADDASIWSMDVTLKNGMGHGILVTDDSRLRDSRFDVFSQRNAQGASFASDTSTTEPDLYFLRGTDIDLWAYSEQDGSFREIVFGANTTNSRIFSQRQNKDGDSGNDNMWQRGSVFYQPGVSGATTDKLSVDGDIVRFGDEGTGSTLFEYDISTGVAKIGTDAVGSGNTLENRVGQLRISGDGATSSDRARFYNDNGEVGSIETVGSATNYNISSDYRKKENDVPIDGALEMLMSLRPINYNFKVDPDTVLQGFFAHEVQEVCPQAVSGEKDGEQLQKLDLSKLIPLIVAAIQQLNSKD